MRKLRGRAGKSGSAYVRFFSGSFFFASAALAVFFEPPDGMVKNAVWSLQERSAWRVSGSGDFRPAHFR